MSDFRIEDSKESNAGAKEGQSGGGRQFRPLYDVPFMFQAREFLRKKLIGKKISYTVDYVQSSINQLPERCCCTVMLSGQNIGEQLVAKGLATVVRHRQADENRSSHYDQLLLAEQQAEKAKLGIHRVRQFGESGEQPTAPVNLDKYTVRVQELQGNASRSKQFLPSLQRTGRCHGVVEFVAAGSRLRIYLPKESILLTLLLGGISCPRPPRAQVAGGQQEATASAVNLLAAEAVQFTKDVCFQKEVDFEVESIDKAGNFIGWCFVNGKNLSELLVEEGLAAVHFTADRGKYGQQLRAAEGRAKAANLKIWTLPEYQVTTADADEEEKDEADPRASETGSILPDRVPQYRAVLVTDIQPDLHFFVQYFDQGDKLEKMMKDLRADLVANPPPETVGGYRPRRGELCAALFSADKQWYRARVEGLSGGDKVDVLYIDFGNRETLTIDQLTPLRPPYSTMAPGAKECALALVKMPSDVDYCAFAVKHFYRSVNNEQCMMSTEYKIGPVEYVTLLQGDTDIGKSLIRNGYCLTEPRRDRKIQSLLADYQEAQAEAKKERLNIWEYGDFTGTDL